MGRQKEFVIEEHEELPRETEDFIFFTEQANICRNAIFQQEDIQKMEEYVSDEEVKIEPIDHRLSRRKSKIEEDRKEIST